MDKLANNPAFIAAMVAILMGAAGYLKARTGEILAKANSRRVENVEQRATDAQVAVARHEGAIQSLTQTAQANPTHPPGDVP